MSTDVGADSSSRFPFRARTNIQTDATERYTSGVRNLVGDPPTPEICAQNDPHPFENNDFDQYPLIAPQLCSNSMTYDHKRGMAMVT